MRWRWRLLHRTGAAGATRLPSMMAVGAAIGVFANVTGLYLSYYLNIAAGPTMVLVATLIFGLVFLLAPGRGIMARRMARRRHLTATGV